MNLPHLPTLDELLHPETQPEALRQQALSCEDPLDPIHLFRITWKEPNGEVTHRVLPPELTGVEAPIVVMCGYKYPTGSHKVGPVYSCVRDALLAGELEGDDATLIFPSTGNYGIGGSWVGPRMGFRSIIVLPEEMSTERFEKIRAYGAEIIATPGCESNVKEIYDCVNNLRKDPNNRILNQFEAFGNYRFHHHVTGGCAVELAEQLQTKGIGSGQVGAFVSAMGSAGTIAAADRIQKSFPACRIVGVEPIQCPTMFNVGYGGHAIEGIGDKHVTWIHNARNMDLLVCIDDHSCLQGLQLLQEGHEHLAAELGIAEDILSTWTGTFGISAVCNILASIQTARYYQFDANQPVYTVATDGFDRYPSVMERLTEKEGPMTREVAKKRIELFHGARPTQVLEGTMEVRRRWHNQKYFTWVEQQGKTVQELEALWSPSFWQDQVDMLPELDQKTLALR